MAIVWSSRYPGQVAVDPGYPHGKPRNVSVPGDGSGTPLEAAWVSDLAGWQAALLAEAGITPSGQPDTATVSDYTNAIKSVAAISMTSSPHNWTAAQTFQGNLGVGGEVVYVDAAGAPTRKTHDILIPLTDFSSWPGHDATSINFTLVNDKSNPPKPYWVGSTGPTLMAEVSLRHNTQILGASALVVANGSIALTVNLRTADAAGNTMTFGGSANRSSDGQIDLTLPTPLTVQDGVSVPLIYFTTGSGNFRVHWVKLRVSETGP